VAKAVETAAVAVETVKDAHEVRFLEGIFPGYFFNVSSESIGTKVDGLNRCHRLAIDKQRGLDDVSEFAPIMPMSAKPLENAGDHGFIRRFVIEQQQAVINTVIPVPVGPLKKRIKSRNDLGERLLDHVAIRGHGRKMAFVDYLPEQLDALMAPYDVQCILIEL